MGREKRLPAFKISVGADLRGFFHTHVFQRVYPGSFVWPDYKPRQENT